MKAEQLRKIPSTLSISKIKTYKKDPLIKAILNMQNQNPQKPQFPQQIKREDSDLKTGS